MTNVNIRNVDPAIWKAMRVEAIQRGISMAQLIELLWQQRTFGIAKAG